MANTDERGRTTTAWQGVPDRFSERVGGRSQDAGDAGPGSDVIDMNGDHIGTVTAAEGKYIGVEGEDGDQFWLAFRRSRG
jgi:hypothetical protein